MLVSSLSISLVWLIMHSFSWMSVSLSSLNSFISVIMSSLDIHVVQTILAIVLYTKCTFPFLIIEATNTWSRFRVHYFTLLRAIKIISLPVRRGKIVIASFTYFSLSHYYPSFPVSIPSSSPAIAGKKRDIEKVNKLRLTPPHVICLEQTSE